MMIHSETEVITLIDSGLPRQFTLVPGFWIKKILADAVIFYKKQPVCVVETKRLVDSETLERMKSLFIECLDTINARFFILCTPDLGIYLFDSDKKDFEAGPISIEAFFDRLLSIYAEGENPLPEEESDELLRILQHCADEHKLRNKQFYDWIKNLDISFFSSNCYVTKGNSIIMSSELENLLLRNILGTVDDDTICRYTSFHSVMRIMKEKKASVCGIACMNDKSECYYVDQYLEGKFGERSLKDMSISEVNELNEYFIMSCSSIQKHDKLTMWRMYGADASGCCISYKIDYGRIKDSLFYLAPVSYALQDRTHPELDYIRSIMNSSIRGKRIQFQMLSLWKHFFKPFDYEDENEIRLLYHESDTSKYKWIYAGNSILCPIIEFGIEAGSNVVFPLIFDSIYLGPKCLEKDTNMAQLKRLSSLQNIERSRREIYIDVSKIDNYR